MSRQDKMRRERKGVRKHTHSEAGLRHFIHFVFVKTLPPPHLLGCPLRAGLGLDSGAS